MPKPLTSAQVAAQLGISPRAVQALAKRRGIARVGRDWLFSPAQVQSLSTPLPSGPKPRKDRVMPSFSITCVTHEPAPNRTTRTVTARDERLAIRDYIHADNILGLADIRTDRATGVVTVWTSAAVNAGELNIEEYGRYLVERLAA